MVEVYDKDGRLSELDAPPKGSSVVMATYDLAGEQSFTGAERTVPIDTVRKNDAPSGVFTLSGFGEIAVNRKMEVEVSARIGVGVETGDTFGDVEAWLEVDGVEVAGSKMFL